MKARTVMPPLTLGDLQEIKRLTGREYICAMMEGDDDCFQLRCWVNPDKTSELRAYLGKLGFEEKVLSPTEFRYTKVEHYPDRYLLIGFQLSEWG